MMRELTALPLLAVLLAGCASSPQNAQSTPSTPSPTGTGQFLSGYRELARCLRGHGMPDFPDPVVDPRTGEVTLPPGTRKPTEAAMNACRSIADRLPAKGGGRSVSAAEMDQLKKLARCIRDNGLREWPDPDPDGAFPLPARLTAHGKAGFRRQFEACRQYLPQRGFTVRNPQESHG
ncbi:hypothetical protein Skr01_51410 [Sphaerisporangium krabiense]|uniref:Uncharacterized protein YceK n=1 Tax=Sphaerisporangium krabiense TaxID=763782 RepID=A0A7W8Z9X7_9ACTN|nr:hypothetical protein [Sphaerisporangium krabiense]MBB5630108.1 uncharacterized protein YceK [Sphaerisporangium krabiense]GII65056.1 hypothetical protein Skr01_51410 [Sphaerisporangium krabiense]